MLKKLLIIITVSVLTGCNDNYLDITPTDRIVDEYVWEDENLVQLYVNGLYDGIPHGFNSHLWSKYTDEAYGDNDWLMGLWTPDNITNYGDASNYIDYYKRAYQFIRRCNVFFENIEESVVGAEKKEEMKAQVHFVRAFIYANLLWRYGGMPIVEDVYDLDDRDKLVRNSYQELVDYIVEELDLAFPNLPEKYNISDADFGRATQDAVLALKSRLYLYAASELNNPENDLDKWQLAANAAKAIIDRGSAYQLVEGYENTYLDVNEELIFARTFSNVNGHLATFTLVNNVYGGWGGWGGRNVPSENLVEAYEMDNGEMLFNRDGSLNPASGYDPQNPYVNRDPRFYETVIFNGDTFRPELRGAASPKYDVTVSVSGFASNGTPQLTGAYGADNYRNSSDNSLTSYSWKKFIDRTLPVSRSNGGYAQPWIFFRLAEIYLNYAEASFELGDEMEARTYVNLVRKRAGMPDIGAGITGEELKERIRHERRIELVMEGHRFFDVRRWKIAPEIESEDIRGVDIFKLPNGELVFRTKTLIERPEWREEFYWIPIPRGEINKNAGLAQSPHWN